MAATVQVLPIFQQASKMPKPNSRSIKAWLPPIIWHTIKTRMPWLVRALGGHFTHSRFTGNFASFEEATHASTGYNADLVLAKTREAAAAARDGKCRWERDAMMSDEETLPWSLLACLSRALVLKGDKRLTILDFGGSLGSLYRWCKPYFAPEFQVYWRVVELANHVEAGRAEFEDEYLRFYYSVEEALQHGLPDVLLISGSLHYLKDPEAELARMVSHAFPHVILDRILLWDRPVNQLTVQKVPREIYDASYPAWFLSKERILGIVENQYTLRMRAHDDEHWEVESETVCNTLYHFELRKEPAPAGSP